MTSGDVTKTRSRMQDLEGHVQHMQAMGADKLKRIPGQLLQPEWHQAGERNGIQCLDESIQRHGAWACHWVRPAASCVAKNCIAGRPKQRIISSNW